MNLEVTRSDARKAVRVLYQHTSTGSHAVRCGMQCMHLQLTMSDLDGTSEPVAVRKLTRPRLPTLTH